MFVRNLQKVGVTQPEKQKRLLVSENELNSLFSCQSIKLEKLLNLVPHIYKYQHLMKKLHMIDRKTMAVFVLFFWISMCCTCMYVC